jgi:hypothetical protein
MEKEIVNVIEEKGPLTGKEILDEVGGDELILWRTCRLSRNLASLSAGTSYLRLDRAVDGFARLSPSILRQFFTYSVTGLAADIISLRRRVRDVTSHIEAISRAKLDLAYRIASGQGSRIESDWAPEHGFCFIIAGDIVYNMAHDVPRTERSTGKLVRGSDMDMVIVVDDSFPEDIMQRLDDGIYREKHRLLMTPHLKEEIDYVVKRLDRVREQVRFDTFRRMLACKILHEGTLLYGSEVLFNRVKGMLREHGVVERLRDLEESAREFRRKAEATLLREDPEKIRKDHLHLFYPTAESEEFE